MSARTLLLVGSLALACARAEPAPSPGATPDADDDSSSRNHGLPRGDREAVRNAVTKARGRDPGEDVCAAWPQTFPKVVVVGGFAHDRGCMPIGAFVGRKWFDRMDEATVAGLTSAGWVDGALEKREPLARAWVQEVLQAFGGHFVTEPTRAFELDDTPEFTPVGVRATESLGVVVSGWVQEPPGMVYEETYALVEYRFDPEGRVTTSSSHEFSVPGERLRGDASR